MRKIPPTQDLVAFVDDEDYESLASFKWCASRSGSTFYAVRNVRLPNGRKRKTYMHRVILGVASEKWIDHENRNGLDNRRENLRVATNRQNLQNSRKRSGTVSRFKGVSFDKHYRKWQARIQACTIGPGGHVRRVFLGSFDDEEDAARAYDAAALASFGRFARMNFMEQKVACND